VTAPANSVHSFSRSAFHTFSVRLPNITVVGRRLFLAFEDWVCFSLYVMGLLHLANLYISLDQSLIKALRNVGLSVSIDATHQPVRFHRVKPLCEVSDLGRCRHLSQVDETVDRSIRIAANNFVTTCL
jgi:hypothetical protein